MALEMKYFVLNPRSKKIDDEFAEASRKAMRAYARHIYKQDQELAESLEKWANTEADKAHDMKFGTDFA